MKGPLTASDSGRGRIMRCDFMLGWAASSENIRYAAAALLAVEAVACNESLAHLDGRELPPSILVLRKAPPGDPVSIAAEQVEQEHGLENVLHDERAVLHVARERELDGRSEGGEGAHREELEDLHVFVVDRDLAKPIRQVHRTLDHEQVQPKTPVGGDEVERPITQVLLPGMKGSNFVRKHFLGHAGLLCPRRRTGW